MSKRKGHNSNRRRDSSARMGRVIKTGAYDGSSSTNDFVVHGHSTGAAGTEMEAMAHDVSIAAGKVPDYETDADYTTHAGVIDETEPDNDQEFEDLGGPELYGPNPSLLKASPIADQNRLRRFGLWGALGIFGGLAGAAALGFAAYKLSQNPEVRKRFTKA